MSAPPPDLSGFNFDRPGDLPSWLPPQPPKKRRKWPFIVAAVFAAFLVIGIVAPKQDADTSSKTASVAAVSTSSTPLAVTTSATPTPEPTLAVASVATTVNSAESANAALLKLEALPVKGRAPKTGYGQDMFGQAWTDDVDVDSGHNGCDTRNDILRRDLTATVMKPGSHGCTVLTGSLADPYTGRAIALTRGTASSAVQIDHVVTLSDAWQTGAQRLSITQRQDFANDPRNLQATDGPTDERKGDGDAATWLPANTSYRCTYVSRQIDVKAVYKLWVTQPEKDAMVRVLTGCGATPPVTSTIPSPVAPPTTQSRPAPPPVQAYVPPPTTTYQAPPAAGNDSGSGCGGDSYVNSDGNCIHSPVAGNSAPDGATAQCEDGTYSFSQHRRGTCSGHGGVGAWL
ncbi:DUF3761 domain-containing protein [Williamsia herbipolensis]|uniref:DUF3761 domain-containing protein n=1 Tax=Williamsia herbipolensis TaxID=1603258 RepID=A0AAU4K164_9NOCA|nr:DUF3761 domain-containing protein [Williamsia herbipolensis]